jgi:hypothetical protein
MVTLRTLTVGISTAMLLGACNFDDGGVSTDGRLQDHGNDVSVDQKTDLTPYDMTPIDAAGDARWSTPGGVMRLALEPGKSRWYSLVWRTRAGRPQHTDLAVLAEKKEPLLQLFSIGTRRFVRHGLTVIPAGRSERLAVRIARSDVEEARWSVEIWRGDDLLLQAQTVSGGKLTVVAGVGGRAVLRPPKASLNRVIATQRCPQ